MIAGDLGALRILGPVGAVLLAILVAVATWAGVQSWRLAGAERDLAETRLAWEADRAAWERQRAEAESAARAALAAAIERAEAEASDRIAQEASAAQAARERAAGLEARLADLLARGSESQDCAAWRRERILCPVD